VLDLSVEQILAYGVSISFTTIVGTACWCVRDRRSLKSKLAIMDRVVQHQLRLERERSKRPHRELDRPRPPPR
jgi:hypothetical protein